jgi:hypothetical protein
MSGVIDESKGAQRHVEGDWGDVEDILSKY